MNNFSGRRNIPSLASAPYVASPVIQRPRVGHDKLTGVIPEIAAGCTVHISASHYFADKYIFSNLYGDSFFPEQSGFIRENPYVSDTQGASLLDELFDSSGSTPLSYTETQKKILSAVDPHFIKKDAAKKNGRVGLEFTTEGLMFEDEHGNVVVSYGAYMPDEVRIAFSGYKVVSVTTPGGLLENLPIHDGKTTHRIISLLPDVFLSGLKGAFGDTFDEFVSDGGLELDCLITSKISRNTVNIYSGGILEAEYTVVSGTRKIEHTSLFLVIEPHIERKE